MVNFVSVIFFYQKTKGSEFFQLIPIKREMHQLYGIYRRFVSLKMGGVLCQQNRFWKTPIKIRKPKLLKISLRRCRLVAFWDILLIYRMHKCLADSIQRCLPQAELTVVLQHTCPVDLKGIRELRFVLPKDFRAIPFIDKMFAAAAFEEKATCPLLWLDIDSFFLKKPEFTSKAALRLNPVDQRNIGDLYGEERSLLWQILMKYFALDPTEQFPVRTGISAEWIYPYFNVGMVYQQRTSQIFGLTRTALCRLLPRLDLQALLNEKYSNTLFLHQAVFTAAVLKTFRQDQIQSLPNGTNYPLHLHAAQTKPICLEDLCSIRYDTFFAKNEVPPSWQPLLGKRREDLHMRWYYE